MLRATSASLRGEPFANLGVVPDTLTRPLAAVARGLNRLPLVVREATYALGGWGEAIPRRRVARVDMESVSAWATGLYPERRYPAVVIGASNAIPFWLSFPTDPAAAAIESYLEVRPAFSEIGVMLFSHGVDSVGLVPLSRWRSILRRATRRGTFVGVDEHAYPRDFATVICYHAALGHRFAAEAVDRPPLTLGDVDAFLQEESSAAQWC